MSYFSDYDEFVEDKFAEFSNKKRKKHSPIDCIDYVDIQYDFPDELYPDEKPDEEPNEEPNKEPNEEPNFDFLYDFLDKLPNEEPNEEPNKNQKKFPYIVNSSTYNNQDNRIKQEYKPSDHGERE